MAASTNFQQPVGSGSTLIGGQNLEDIIKGLATPYQQYQYSDPRGYLADSTPDPNAVWGQAQQAAVAAEVPIPDWKTLYNTAVEMRQQRLQQEIAAMQGTSNDVLAQVSGLIDQPLPTIPGGPLGEEFAALYKSAGNFAKAEVPMQRMAAEGRLRANASKTLDDVLSNLTSTNYQGQVQQAVNRPGNVMSAFGSFSDLAGQRAANARAELDAIIKQELDDSKNLRESNWKRYDAGVDLTKQGIISGTQLGVAGIQAETSANNTAANIASREKIAADNAKAAMDRITAKAIFDINDPKNKALTEKYTQEALLAQQKAKNGGPLTEGDKRRALAQATLLGQIDNEFSAWGGIPQGWDASGEVHEGDLSNPDEAIRTLAYQTLTNQIGTSTAKTFIDRMARSYASTQVPGKNVKGEKAKQREAAYKQALKAYQDQYNRINGTGMDPDTKARALAIMQHNTSPLPASREVAQR